MGISTMEAERGVYDVIKNFQSLNLFLKKDRITKSVRTDKKFEIFDVEMYPGGTRLYFNVRGVNEKGTCQIMTDKQFILLLKDGSLYHKP